MTVIRAHSMRSHHSFHLLYQMGLTALPRKEKIGGKRRLTNVAQLDSFPSTAPTSGEMICKEAGFEFFQSQFKNNNKQKLKSKIDKRASAVLKKRWGQGFTLESPTPLPCY